MAKHFFILFSALLLQLYAAAPNAEGHLEAAAEDSPQNDQANPNLNSEPYQASEASVTSKDHNLQGQRQKRFNDYSDFDFPSYGSYNFNFIKRDYSQNTAVLGTQEFLLQLLKRVQTIASYTRQRAFSPPIAHFSIPSFFPLYVLRGNCDCNAAEAPNTGEEPHTPGNDAFPTQPPITPSPPPADTTQGAPPIIIPDSTPTADTDVTMPSFTTRMMGEDDEDDDDVGDGSRPISFVPVRPKSSPNRPFPPVDHGTVQASKGTVNKFSSTLRPPAAIVLEPQSLQSLDSKPGPCDNAVMICCHMAEVNYDCFKAQGCPNPISPDSPCEKDRILSVIAKFQNRYKSIGKS